MNKVYKRFFDELEPQHLQYIDELIKEIEAIASGRINRGDSNAPFSNPMRAPEDRDFFLHLQNLNFISPVAIKENIKPLPLVQYGITQFFTPYLDYYAKNLRKKS